MYEIALLAGKWNSKTGSLTGFDPASINRGSWLLGWFLS